LLFVIWLKERYIEEVVPSIDVGTSLLFPSEACHRMKALYNKS